MKKLIALNLIGLLTVVGLATLLWYNARQANATLQDVDEASAVATEADEIRTEMIQMSDAMRGFLLNPAKQDEFDKKKQADEALVASVDRLLGSTTNTAYTDLAKQIGDLDEQKLDKIEDRVLELAPGNAKLATSVYFGEYLPVRAQQMALVDQLRTMAKTELEGQVRSATANLERTMALVLSVGGVVVLLMFGAFGWSVKTTRGVERQVSTETSTMSETAEAVLRASKEVSRAAQSLSQGATEQASSLEETSASMEEMASMTRQNADHSQEVVSLMKDVEQRVHASNSVLGEMVSAMQAAQESSQRVAKIIKTIDEVAFQTNILALNAAVEAARAGEAGMGFAVVADEVRSLAQRSAQAAKDTADLIETSIATTRTGADKVDRVATAITEITGRVQSVKGLADEVSAACRQQSQGIDQVAQAIMQMEKVTQGTAAAAQQSAASSEELAAQAETARQVVGRLEVLVGAKSAGPAIAANTSRPEDLALAS